MKEVKSFLFYILITDKLVLEYCGKRQYFLEESKNSRLSFPTVLRRALNTMMENTADLAVVQTMLADTLHKVVSRIRLLLAVHRVLYQNTATENWSTVFYRVQRHHSYLLTNFCPQRVKARQSSSICIAHFMHKSINGLY